MSYAGLLGHRVTIYRLTQGDVDGQTSYTWDIVATNVPAFVDTSFIRIGKDPTWTEEAGRSPDRSGVAFFKYAANVNPGDRVQVTRGPAGQFEIISKDPVWAPTRASHVECGIAEVSSQLGTA